MTWATDNRWRCGTGVTVPEDAPAAYGARWIDQGDRLPADVLPDRQGFAYDTEGAKYRLIDLMIAAGESIRVPHKVGLVRDETTVVMSTPEWKMYQRRAGGYIYVDAWLVPA